MTRLSPGTVAPALVATDMFGKSVDLQALRGRKVMLSFYRYAGCPLCNLRVHELVQAYPALQASLTVLAVFQSPVGTLKRFVIKQDVPFALIADPKRELYRRFKVETSLGGMLRAMASPGRLFDALKRGFWPGSIEGPLHAIPADFLIDEQGIIYTAYYGRDIGDHLPLEQIANFAGSEAKT